MPPLPGALKGTLVGIGNLLISAAGMAAAEQMPGVGMVVIIYAGIPALAVGVMLGSVAELVARCSVGLRLAVLIVPAVAVVVGLGYAFQTPEYIAPVAVPTVVACLVLERWTRVITPPPVPVARAV